LEWTKQLRPTIEFSRNANQTGVESVATLSESLTDRDLGSQSLTLWTVRIIVDGVRPIASPIRDRSHLFVRIRETVRENDRGEVDLNQARNGGQAEFFILSVENGGRVGSVCSTVTFCSHMEGCLGVLREAGKEQLEECIHILSGRGAAVNRRAVIRVGVSDVDGLVEEENIAVRIPGVFIVGHVRFISDLARAQLKEQSGGRRTTRATYRPIVRKLTPPPVLNATICPIYKVGSCRVLSGFKEPKAS
jgi:hypothetical protein